MRDFSRRQFIQSTLTTAGVAVGTMSAAEASAADLPPKAKNRKPRNPSRKHFFSPGSTIPPQP